ncbi:hypothetical protein J31TS6_22480 [Brevibacillus reuszeri]|uniref:hypothetical protein n=1 Tax=Brevibacillus reuszeri TaxID=54915 RepID=UPI001B062E17|nr:hypothetical protein [Brevibacillus reuszeri]GIO06220.1 hypothetical protein J31TS6_22480 [Brevibacillus reuszeri]
MRIFSKKTLQFDDPNKQEPPVVVRAQDFATVPEWVLKSSMYQLASADGTVSIVETRADVAAIENAETEKLKKELQAAKEELERLKEKEAKSAKSAKSASKGTAANHEKDEKQEDGR